MHLSGQYQHNMLPDRVHDEGALEDFVLCLKKHIQTFVGPGNQKVYANHAESVFKKANDRSPHNRHEVAKVMKQEPYWQLFSSLNRSAQEAMWDTFGARSERQRGELIQKSQHYRKNNHRKGSLLLDPSLGVPNYNTKVDIHIQPGGYHTDLTNDDVYAGALYDTAVYVYTLHGIGKQNEDLGLTVINYLKNSFPEFCPQKVLDMGCAVGHSTLPYCDSFPNAEIYAIDVAAPVLRYAHARAESMGKIVHFEQRNAEKTGYPDCSFDLIVSHILFHETSSKAVPALMRECHRLLKPGGMMVHAEVPAFTKQDENPYEQFARDWSTHYNAEPFWGKLHEMDLTKETINAGFDPKFVFEGQTPSMLGGSMVQSNNANPSVLGGSMVRTSWQVIQAKK